PAFSDNLPGSAVPPQPEVEQTLCVSCGQAMRPGELACSKCGKVAESRTDLKLKTNHLEDTQAGFECPECHDLCQPGALVCANCGTRFTFDDSTYFLDRRDMLFPFTWDKTTSIAVENDEPIFFEIEGQTLRLPIAEIVDVGRVPAGLGETSQVPYLSLAPLGA